MGRSTIEKRRVQQRDWVRRNPRSVRSTQLKKLYGITIEQYDELFESQGGMCAACCERPAKHVDHDHESGVVRALLCAQCNQAIGLMWETPSWLRSAADYLERHNASR